MKKLNINTISVEQDLYWLLRKKSNGNHLFLYKVGETGRIHDSEGKAIGYITNLKDVKNDVAEIVKKKVSRKGRYIVFIPKDLSNEADIHLTQCNGGEENYNSINTNIEQENMGSLVSEKEETYRIGDDRYYLRSVDGSLLPDRIRNFFHTLR